MKVNSTIDYLALCYKSTQDEGINILRKDIINAIKFDLGDAYTDLPPFKFNDDYIKAPKLPYDLCYFEIIAYDQKTYGGIFENYEGAVCGQILVDAYFEEIPETAASILYPTGLMFIEENGELLLHKENCISEEIGKEALVALMLMVKAIEVINCTNVILIESKEKKFINKKRESKGKLPLFTYKTLHINLSEQEKKVQEQTWTHASPRVHLRRGHIRKLPSGEKIWVQSCIVGNIKNGIVHKDYSVSLH